MLIAIIFKTQCNNCLITVHTNRMRRFQLQHIYMAAKLHLRFRIVQSGIPGNESYCVCTHVHIAWLG
jgi:hypothetical protein